MTTPSISIPKRHLLELTISKEELLQGMDDDLLEEESAVTAGNDDFWKWVTTSTDWPLTTMIDVYKHELAQLRKRWIRPQSTAQFDHDSNRVRDVRATLAEALKAKQRECFMIETLSKDWRLFHQRIFKVQLAPKESDKS
jgi:hypothetical protein